MLDNAQMALAKSDPQIFDDYLSLGGAGTELAERLQHAYAEAVRLVEAVIGGELLMGEPRLKQSIALRNPYIDPIHRIQVRIAAPRPRRGERPGHLRAPAAAERAGNRGGGAEHGVSDINSRE